MPFPAWSAKTSSLASRAAHGSGECHRPAGHPNPSEAAARATRWCISPPAAAASLAPTPPKRATLPEVVIELLLRAGYDPRLPEGFDKLCCGQMLASKGMAEEAEQMAESVTAALLRAADDGHGGHYPVIMDASTCSVRMQKHLAGRLTVLDFHEFAHDALLPRLMVTRKRGPIALHINCSVRRVASDSKTAPP
jgi:D-lactate dehydrogenase